MGLWSFLKKQFSADPFVEDIWDKSHAIEEYKSTHGRVPKVSSDIYFDSDGEVRLDWHIESSSDASDLNRTVSPERQFSPKPYQGAFHHEPYSPYPSEKQKKHGLSYQEVLNFTGLSNNNSQENNWAFKSTSRKKLLINRTQEDGSHITFNPVECNLHATFPNAMGRPNNFLAHGSEAIRRWNRLYEMGDLERSTELHTVRDNLSHWEEDVIKSKGWSNPQIPKTIEDYSSHFSPNQGIEDAIVSNIDIEERLAEGRKSMLEQFMSNISQTSLQDTKKASPDYSMLPSLTMPALKGFNHQRETTHPYELAKMPTPDMFDYSTPESSVKTLPWESHLHYGNNPYPTKIDEVYDRLGVKTGWVSPTLGPSDDRSYDVLSAQIKENEREIERVQHRQHLNSLRANKVEINPLGKNMIHIESAGTDFHSQVIGRLSAMSMHSHGL